MEFAFVIYSCKQNLKRAELLYSLVKGRLRHCSFYILYGDPELDVDYKVIDNKYIAVKTGDGYDHLSEKTIALFRSIVKISPTIKGCFKCDDDIIPHIGHLNQHIQYILEVSPDYSGKNIKHNETYATFQISKNVSDKYKRPIWVPTCNYCPGPLYYLSKTAMMCFEKQPDFHLFEDVMVGMHLFINGFYPDDMPLIKEFKSNRNYISLHNDGGSRQYLFVLLHGRLGNHLFQVFSAYGIAKRSGRKLVIIGETFDVPDFLKIIVNDGALYICKNDFDYLGLLKYDETNEQDPRINCFTYDPNILNNFGENPGLLNGYFQNEKYFCDYKRDVLRFLRNDQISARLLSSYPELSNSYFIHVRRGDYVNHPLYVIDYDNYYKSAIYFILDKDPSAKFYVVSDDIEYCKSYHVFSYFRQFTNETVESSSKLEFTQQYPPGTRENCGTFSSIIPVTQNGTNFEVPKGGRGPKGGPGVPPKFTFVEGLDALDTLYFMSMCSKGGICCNSSFSWWGSYLQHSWPPIDKTVVMPKHWINLKKPVDIFYDGVTII